MKSDFINNMLIKDVLVDHIYTDILVSTNDITGYKNKEFMTDNPDTFYKEATKVIKKQYSGDTSQSHMGEVSYSQITKNNMLIIVRGHPGSAKSTLGKSLTQFNFKHFENDAFFTKNGVYTFDIQHHQTAKDKCYEDTKQALKKGENVVVTNTFTTLDEIKPFIELAKKNNNKYMVIEMYFNYDSIHNVPDAVIQDKKNKFEPFERALHFKKKRHVNAFLEIMKDKHSLEDLYYFDPKNVKKHKKGINDV